MTRAYLPQWVSTDDVDRENDVVRGDAMVRALHAWVGAGKTLPLLWNHGTKATDVVGCIDPESVRAVDGELVTGGRIDLGSEQGRDAWRAVKGGSLGFSFGYVTIDSARRPAGVRELKQIDIFRD